MRQYIYLLLSIITVVGVSSCDNKKQNISETSQQKAVSSEIKYAQGFQVTEYENYKLIDIHDPQSNKETIYKYALINEDTDTKNIPGEYTIIKVPVKRIICMTSLQLSNFIKLDAIDNIVGITSTQYLFNEQIKNKIEKNEISQIGIEGNFDDEIIMALEPDIIMVSPFKRGGYESIKDLNTPLITFLGYKETSALGQAEWIKFTAMLLGLEEKANTQFEEIERKYNDLKKLAASATDKPTILSGEMRSGNWYVVGGRSYLAEQFRDAGAEYFMKDDDRTGGINLDFESVYAQGADADFWRLLVSHTGDYSYDVLEKTDSRYIDFKAFRERKVVYCNLRQKPFYEKAPVEPEVVLADLIKAFHPELLPDYQPTYYELLK
ncbi:MAG: ABC transporter substrate-binding protein [Dysgonomonas sp.]|nr:ABC transporter substrate-binding protein [Dysgonomonas sp.]